MIFVKDSTTVIQASKLVWKDSPCKLACIISEPAFIPYEDAGATPMLFFTAIYTHYLRYVTKSGARNTTRFCYDRTK